MAYSLPTADALAPSRVTGGRPREAPRRLSPAEGWLTVLLHAVILVAAATTVARVPMAPPVGDLAPLAVGGLLVGLVLAKARALDLLAHLLGFLSGAAASFALTVERLEEGTRRERVELLAGQAADWYRSLLSGRQVDDPQLFAVVLGLTAWLVAYTSAWVLYRRGWLATAVLLPGAIATVNLGYLPGDSTAALLVIVVAACVLAARHAVFRREAVWDRAGLPHPARLPWRFLVAGINLALVVALIGWTLPFSARDRVFDAAWERIQEPVAALEERWQEALARLSGNADLGGGSYAAFGDQFRLGGALNLSDDPVMLLRSGLDRPTYLAGYRYDFYTGQGWRSDVEATFEAAGPNGERYPRMAFARGQGVHLSPAVTDDRSQVTGTISVLRPKGNLLFTLDTYLTADRQSVVQLSWQQLDGQPYPLVDGAPAVPVDLAQMAKLLRDGRFPPGDGRADSPAPTDPELAARVEAERRNLAARFLDVSWSVDADGRANALFATGQLPVYDDVEAVFSTDPITEGERYGVVGLASTAPAEALRAAGTDYPAWVKARYLQLPDTITQRTRDLAAELAAAQGNPFDVAINVQTYVRNRIAYEEQIARPPGDQDVVDYVLFESREGYCVYYASSMAVLLRLNGIPARVVGGFYPVPYDPEAGGYLYREKNAHLWVEAFFPGYGWIPFEPTANRDTLDYGADVSAADETATPAAEPPPAPEPEPEATPAPATTEAPPAGAPPPGLLSDPRRALGWAGLGVVTLTVIAALAAALVWNLGFRGLSPVGGAYARSVRAGRFLGVPAAASLTPREYADELGRAVPSARGPIRVVADLYAEERYAERRPSPDRLRAARGAWAQLRPAIVRRLLRRRA